MLYAIGIVLIILGACIKGGVSFLFLVAGVIVFVSGYIKKLVKTDSGRQQTMTSATYNPSRKTLNVYRRSATIGSSVVINEAGYFGRTPMQLHYGSASSGGVTTGGFYTTGGDLQMSSSLRSGRYELDYVSSSVPGVFRAGKKEYALIEKIALTPDLYEEAKKSKIAGFLNNDDKSIQVVKTSEQVLKAGLVSEQEIKAAAGNPESLTAQNLNLRRYPTRSECLEILNWLTHP